MTDILFLLISLTIGFVAGISSGMLGIGGGIVFIPALLFLLPVLGIDHELLVYTTIATSLFAGSFSTFGSCLNHYRKNNINFKLAIIFSAGSALTAIVVPQIIVELDAQLLKYVVLIILVLICMKFLFEKENPNSEGIQLKPLFLFPVGMGIGALSALSGLGGGVITMPILHYFYSLPIKRAVGTSSFVVAITVIISTISFAFLKTNGDVSSSSSGYINTSVGLAMGIGALVGSYFGVKMVFKFKSAIIKKVFVAFIIIAIFKILLDL